MAAVLFTVDDSIEIVSNQITSDTFEWRTAIDRLSPEALRTLVYKWAADNPKMQMELTSLYTGTLPAGVASNWEDELQQMIDDAADRHGYVDYRDAYGLMCDISDYMHQQLDTLLDSGLLMDAFELVHTVFTVADDVEMDDSDGELYMLFSECADAWRKVVDLANDTEQKRASSKICRMLGEFRLEFRNTGI